MIFIASYVFFIGFFAGLTMGANPGDPWRSQGAVLVMCCFWPIAVPVGLYLTVAKQ